MLDVISRLPHKLRCLQPNLALQVTNRHWMLIIYHLNGAKKQLLAQGICTKQSSSVPHDSQWSTSAWNRHNLAVSLWVCQPICSILEINLKANLHSIAIYRVNPKASLASWESLVKYKPSEVCKLPPTPKSTPTVMLNAWMWAGWQNLTTAQAQAPRVCKAQSTCSQTSI